MCSALVCQNCRILHKPKKTCIPCTYQSKEWKNLCRIITLTFFCSQRRSSAAFWIKCRRKEETGTTGVLELLVFRWGIKTLPSALNCSLSNISFGFSVLETLALQLSSQKSQLPKYWPSLWGFFPAELIDCFFEEQKCFRGFTRKYFTYKSGKFLSLSSIFLFFSKCSIIFGRPERSSKPPHKTLRK